MNRKRKRGRKGRGMKPRWPHKRQDPGAGNLLTKLLDWASRIIPSYKVRFRDSEVKTENRGSETRC